MPEAIDFAFLSELEGGSSTSGYVPGAAVSKSGVTIATGFDLGQRSESDLQQLQLGASLMAKLKPYLGLKGAAAQAALKQTPLSISTTEAEAIDKAVKLAHVRQLKTKYNTAAGNEKKFDELPSQAQTVITSVSFQYGIHLGIKAPKFWKAATTQDWPEAAKVLRSFGDAYPTRRRKEAMLLEAIQ